MAKKYRSSHRVHGLHPVKCRAVRWLGAYGQGSSIESIARFELEPRREVACEIVPEDRVSHIDHALVGLLVDQSRTFLVAGYAGDAWTKCRRDRDALGEALPDRRREFDTDWNTVGGLYKAARRLRCDGGRYIEGVISCPRYSAVVVKRDATESAWRFAESIGRLMGLPVIEF